MGGHGSGRWRPRKLRVEDAFPVSASVFKRAEALRDGAAGYIEGNWMGGAWEGWRADWKVRQDTEGVLWVDFDRKPFEVAVVWTAPSLGGRRAWWRCPDCLGRCATIYFCTPRQLGTPACRRCSELAYTSSQSGAKGRAWLFYLKRHSEFAGDGSRPEVGAGQPRQRRAGEHRHTYQRRAERFEQGVSRWDDATFPALLRFARKLRDL